MNESSRPSGPESSKKSSAGEETLLLRAVNKARQARQAGQSGQTLIFMREVLDQAMERSSRKFRAVIISLVGLLVLVGGVAIWQVRTLNLEKSDLDLRIQEIESELRLESELEASATDPARLESLMGELEDYQQRAREIQRNLLYRLGTRNPETDYLEAEIKKLMADFGADQYSVPPEFLDETRVFIERYKTSDRPIMNRALGRSRPVLERLKEIFLELRLPEDLAHIVLVESAFISKSYSSAGAAGLWQFIPLTARAYGLEVSGSVDERLDVEKSTRAAGQYIRDLILNFGAGSSVMLAMAAYNLGPGKVRRAIRRVDDPIKQRDFWYLYRTRALPTETRQYVPKVFAAIIIGRNPEQFGFDTRLDP